MAVTESPRDSPLERTRDPESLAGETAPPKEGGKGTTCAKDPCGIESSSGNERLHLGGGNGQFQLGGGNEKFQLGGGNQCITSPETNCATPVVLQEGPDKYGTRKVRKFCSAQNSPRANRNRFGFTMSIDCSERSLPCETFTVPACRYHSELRQSRVPSTDAQTTSERAVAMD